MSVFTDVAVHCPACSALCEIEAVASVNADRRQDLRDGILDGSFQAVTCAQCGIVFRMPPRFTYIDFARRQWLLAQPSEDIAHWADFEAMSRSLFEQSFGKNSPPAVAEIGRGLTRRVTFGWPALREKILCQQEGLDDVGLELLKAAVLRNVPGAPVADETELRYDGSDGDDLVLGWFVAQSEECLARLRIPRETYDAIEADHETWRDLRSAFDGAVFVDLNRMME